MKRPPLALPACLLAFSFHCLGCSAPEIITGCSDEAGAQVICGFQNPEDLALLSDGHTLIVSEFGGAMDGKRAGKLRFFDARTEESQIAYQGSRDVAAGGPGVAGWGDELCPGQPGRSFSPHGIDMRRLRDGRLMLAVVNHGGRESVELFEVKDAGAKSRIHWRGCAIAPAGSLFNDVVVLPDGGFLVSHMMDPGAQLSAMLQSAFGRNTGWVYEWQRGRGFMKVPGSDGNIPNGLELSEDGRELYLNEYGADRVRRISRETGETLASARISAPDNSSWSRDGMLLVASHIGGVFDCAGVEAGTCGMPFSIHALDPLTLEGQEIFSGRGAGTVAVDLGSELLIGTFSGERLLKAQLDTP